MGKKGKSRPKAPKAGTAPSIPLGAGKAAKRKTAESAKAKPAKRAPKRSRVIDTGVIYCGDNLEQLAKLPDGCIDLICIDPPFNSNPNYEAFWGETQERRSFADRHAGTQAYIEFMRPREFGR